MRPWIFIAGAITCVAAFVPLVQPRARADQGRPGALAAPSSSTAAPKRPSLLPLAGIELDKLVVREDEVTAPAPLGRTAHLSIDPALQRSASRVLREYA